MPVVIYRTDANTREKEKDRRLWDEEEEKELEIEARGVLESKLGSHAHMHGTVGYVTPDPSAHGENITTGKHDTWATRPKGLNSALEAKYWLTIIALIDPPRFCKRGGGRRRDDVCQSSDVEQKRRSRRVARFVDPRALISHLHRRRSQ